MKRLVFAIGFICVVGAPAFAEAASVDINDVDSVPFLSANCKKLYKEWTSIQYNRAFAINPRTGACGRSWGNKNVTFAIESALEKCPQKPGDKCFVYAQNDKVVWDGNITQSTSVADGAATLSGTDNDIRLKEAQAKAAEDRRQKEALAKAEDERRQKEVQAKADEDRRQKEALIKAEEEQRKEMQTKSTTNPSIQGQLPNITSSQQSSSTNGNVTSGVPQTKDTNPTKSIENNQVKNNTVETNNSKAEGSTAPHFNFKQYFVQLIIVVLLLINFTIYNLFPKYRFLLIATPFDIGAKGEKSEAEHAIKTKRYLIEFILFLFLVCIAYYLTSDFDHITFIETLKFGVMFYAISHVCYVLIRFMIAYSTRCPSCKNYYAAKTVNSYQEPKSTFERRGKRYVGTQEGQWIHTYERGLVHKDCRCVVCGHEWHETKTYEKQIGESSTI